MKKDNRTDKIRIISMSLLAMILTTACEQEFYEDEQYRKEIYLMSDDDNIFGQEFEFGEESIGHLSVYAGGVTSIDHEVTVELVRDELFLQQYNQRVKGEDYDSYAMELATGRYTIDNMTVTLRPDAKIPYSLCPIRVNIDGLSPDETYFIPLRIKHVSDYMVSDAKRNVLLQIFMKNDYATTKTDTYYSMSGTAKKNNEKSTQVTATKLVVPISQYAIRILPSATQTANKGQIRKQGIAVTIHPHETVEVPILNDEGLETGEHLTMQKVTVASWMDAQEALEVQEIEGKSSYYDPEKKEYTLLYRYKLSDSGDWYEMKEVMRPLLN